MSTKLAIALTAIAATVAAVALYSMTTLAGEIHLDFPAFARVNVTDDPHGYAPAIAMPTKIQLHVVIDNEAIEITSDPPWVDVAGTILDGEDIEADGSGTVLGVANIDVEFDGTFSDGIITGTYRMGTDLDLPPQNGDPAPIEYTLKPNVEPTATPTNTPTPTPTFTPTNTSPAPATPTNTSPPPATATATSPSPPPPSPTPTNTAPAGPVRDGDLNKDGVTNSIDSLFVLQYVAQSLVSLPNAARADVNGDGIVNVLDAQLMLQYSAGFLDHLPTA